MIANHVRTADSADVWSRLAAPVPAPVVQWRMNGKPRARDGKWFAPFVAYIDAQFVRDRLDMVVPGEWDLTLELLPPLLATGGDGEANDAPVGFKARLQILGVIREDVGSGADYKTAATDAFKRAAVRFGIGHELYTDYEILWVQVESDAKYARPVEDPAEAYARRQARAARANGNGSSNGAKRSEGEQRQHPTSGATRGDSPASATASGSTTRVTAEEGDVIHDGTNDPKVVGEPACPKCGGRCWDNRAANDARLAKGEKLRPDWKCRDKTCEGVIWRETAKGAGTRKPASREKQPLDIGGEDEIPF
jgi:hypothetical protein